MVEMFYFFLNILIGFEIFVKIKPLPGLGLIINTKADKKNEFFGFFFEICCTVQNVAKDKTCFLFIKTGFSFVFFKTEP
jgi:hypothetical protein